MASSTTEYAGSMATSTSKSKSSRWKDLGMSKTNGTGSSFANLLRSAGRKSSESLRSLKSNASRKSTSHGNKNNASSSLAVPAMPENGASTIIGYNKALPPSPSTPGITTTSRQLMTPIESDTLPNRDTSMLSPSPTAPAALSTTGGNSSIDPPPPKDSSLLASPRVSTNNDVQTAESDLSEGLSTSKSASDLRHILGGSNSKTSLVGIDENQPNLSRKNSLSKFKKTSSSSSTTSHTPFAASSSGGLSRSATTEATSVSLGGGGGGGGGGTQWASEKNGGGDGNTIAQLYAVFGLPKDPAVWTLAEEDCVAGVHHSEGAVGRFWRPEVLGCSICPSPSDVLSKKEVAVEKDSAASKWSGRDAGGKKPSNPKFIEMADGRGGTEKAETARVLSKALKLSFTREIEIIAEQGNYPPSATSHTFSFSVPTLSGSGEARGNTPASFDGRRVAGAMGVSVGKANAASGVGEGYGLENRAKVQGTDAGTEFDEGPSPATFYGVVLTVWSAADDKRAKTIKKELARVAKQRGTTTTTATATAKSSKRSNGTAGGGTNDWSEANEYADEEEDRVASPSLNNFSSNNTFFMPYAICIVSRYPLYNLLGDWNKMAWHKYSRNIEMHNQLMSTILRHPAPRLGEKFSVGSPDKDLSFHCTFPGALEWGTGLIGIDLTMWPLFKTLSVDNILTICEVALAHNGRVLFQSRHPALLGIAVETIKYLVELCGWRGVANQNCHARDVKIYLEDPGSWLIAINTELRSIIKPAKEICLVDLDINFVNCIKPPLGAVSTRQAREKKKRRLLQSVSSLAGVEASPPREIVEAYPGGRFRPLSAMNTRDVNSAYEQLASPIWWNQIQVIQAFDKVLRQNTKSSFLTKVLKTRSNKLQDISESESAAILALRRRASTFVDARDGLENKIGRLNKRLAFLMSESDMWRAQFGKIQTLVDRLTKEANDLRSKVDKERRESRRLSSTLAQRDIEQVQIRLQLKETETAREEAQVELLKMQRAMESLETEREAMMDEIRAVLSGAGGVEDVNLSLSRLDLPLPSYNPLIRNESPTGSQVSMTPSQAAEYILKSRANAEARINEGRPGRVMSRNGSSNGHIRSLSQDRGERQFKNSSSNMSAAQSTSSHVNHFPDDQMNYEIQQRTSVVTNQISKIQAQLENTLTQLEGRRSGTADKENDRRRGRRTSNASLNSTFNNSRYEYRTPSSLGGHGGASSSIGHGLGPSSIGHGSEDGRSEMMYDYAQVENVKGGEGDRSLRRKRDLPSSLSLNSTMDAPSNNIGNLRPAVSPTALTSGLILGPSVSPTAVMNNNFGLRTPTSPHPPIASQTLPNNGSTDSPLLGAKSPTRQSQPLNPWKQVSNDANIKAVNNDNNNNTLERTDATVVPTYENEIMVGSIDQVQSADKPITTTAASEAEEIPLPPPITVTESNGGES